MMSNAEITTILKELLKKKDEIKSTRVRFPIETKEELVKLDQEILEHEDSYVATLKSMIKPGGIIKNFNKIIGNNLIINYNYDGQKGKEAFKEFKNINSVLFKALIRDGYREADFVKDIRDSFRNQKNKYFKKEATKRKANK